MSKNTNAVHKNKRVFKNKPLDDFFHDKPKELKVLFDCLDLRIHGISKNKNVTMRTRTQTIVYETTRIFAELRIQKKAIRFLLFCEGEPYHSDIIKTERIPETHRWGKLKCRFSIHPEDINAIDSVLSMVKQAYNAV